MYPTELIQWRQTKQGLVPYFTEYGRYVAHLIRDANISHSSLIERDANNWILPQETLKNLNDHNIFVTMDGDRPILAKRQTWSFSEPSTWKYFLGSADNYTRVSYKDPLLLGDKERP